MPIETSLPCCCPGIFFLAVGLSLTYAGYTKYKLVEKIKNTPTSKVRSAAAGLVELFGKAKCQEKLISPITKSTCTYWKVDAQYYYQTKNSSGWRTFYSDLSGKQFFLEDDTGKMLIDTKSAQVSIPPDFHFQGHLSDKAFFGLIPQQQLDAKVLAYLEENPNAEAAFKGQGGRLIRVYEYYIAEGNAVYVLGSAQPLEGASRAVAHENLIVRKNNIDKMMFISDSSETKIVGGNSLEAWIYLFLGLGITISALIVMLFGAGTIML